MKEQYKSKVSLLCATCGGEQFHFNDDKTYIKCELCDREYQGGYDELVALNQDNIDRSVKDISDQVVTDLKADIAKIFKGNKNIKLS